MSAAEESEQCNDKSLVAATRIHLGKQSTPPPQTKLNSMVLSFLLLSSSSPAIIRTAIAVDPESKIPGYNLVQAVREAIDHAATVIKGSVECDLIPVTPWGNFVPALNALVSWACTSTNGNADRILFVSAETSLSSRSIEELCRHVNLRDTLVAGVALPGHDYRGGDGCDRQDDLGTVVELNGRTTPWNTCAVWNLRKLALTGFPLVADGLHRHDDGSPGVSGIEEFSTILLSQQLTSLSSNQGSDYNKAKLVKISGVEWMQTFEDEERKKWHESKMKSKTTRAERHRHLVGGSLKGWVLHC